MNKFIFKGTTRTAFMFFKYAIKIPRIYNVKMFVNGWESNITEFEFSQFLQPYVTPTIFSFYGLINIQHRIVLSNNEKEIIKRWDDLISSAPEDVKQYLLNHVEAKISGLGYLNGKVVACDYG